jgi:hypothetical protein
MKQITELQAKNFKRSYSYKMGGTQTLIFPNGQTFVFNDKEYYSGRGAKYNSSVKHENLGEIVISKKEVSEFLKREKERSARIKQSEKEKKEKARRYEAAKAQGLYEIDRYEYGNFILLTDEESYKRFFDVKRLAKTLDISEQDAALLQSEGKTYVYAKQSNGNIIELYHSSLDCNRLSISVDFDAQKKFEEMTADRDSWVNAPYADLVGQTTASNHFVC